MGINDIVNKQYQSCGCIYTSELNIINNTIHDNYIQLCKNHYLLVNNKFNYKLDKKNKLYILKESKSDINNNKKVIINNSDNDLESNKIIKFGKYKNKTYDYVYNIDKLYCYHLAYWKDINLNNIHINNFINFIKLKVL